MKWLTTFYLLLSALVQVHAQTKEFKTIKFIDAQTRQPIIAATIWANGSTLIGQTDTTGVFKLSIDDRIPSTDLEVRCIGYQSWRGRLSALALEPLVALVPMENALETVVVSATLKEVSKDLSPIPVEVFSAKFFRKNASPSLFEALYQVNGVRPQTTCSVCGTGHIQINGLDGPYTMVTIDGMPIVSGLSTVYGLSGIPNGMVERIEVVKGPAGILYGSEAVGGMINVITKNVFTAPRAYADAYATNIGEYNLDAAVALKTAKAHTLLGVNYFNYGTRLDINQDNFTDVALQNRISVFNKWSFLRKQDYLATLSARFMSENRWGGEMTWDSRWRGTDSIYGESIYTRRYELLTKYQLPFTQRKVFLDASWNLHDQNSVYGTTTYLGNQSVSFAQLTSDLPISPVHDAIVGMALRHTRYDDNTPATSTATGEANQPSHTLLPGLFIQDEVKLTDRHLMLLGIRYDYNSRHGNIFTPRLSLKWAKDPHHIIRFTTGSGYRVANIFTEDHAALTGARKVVITERLRPERSWNGNLNFTRKFYPKGDWFIGIDASAFYTYFKNQILPDYTTNADQIIYDNLNGYAVSSGLTMNLDMQWSHGLKLNTGTTLMRVYRVEDQQRFPQLFAPPFSGTWTLSYQIPKWHLAIDYTGNVNSPMYLPVVPNDYRPERSPWYALHNVQFTRHFHNGLEVYAAVKNILGFYPNQDVILRAFDPFDKHIHIQNPNGYTFDTAYSYAPVQRQRLLIGLRWTRN